MFRCVETSSADKFLRALVLEGGRREGEGKKERKEKERKKERTADVRGMRRNLNKATESPQGSTACACVRPSPHPPSRPPPPTRRGWRNCPSQHRALARRAADRSQQERNVTKKKKKSRGWKRSAAVYSFVHQRWLAGLTGRPE